MWSLTLKNLAANRVRLLLTGFAVVLAVSFVVSAFVLADGLRKTFGALSEDIVGGIDFELTPVGSEFGFGNQDVDPDADPDVEPTVFDEELLQTVNAVDGVEDAIGGFVIFQALRPTPPDGEVITFNGPPVIVSGWDDNRRLTSTTIEEGRAPTAAQEFTMDFTAADLYGFEIGEDYDFVGPEGTETMTMVGLTRFGTDNDTVGAVLVSAERDYLMDLFEADEFTSIVIALGGGADRNAVEVALNDIDPGMNVKSQATLQSETAADFNTAVDVITYVLLGFAGVSLFVSTFIIANTFAIVLSQRTREMALLRTIGAAPGQLTRSVLLEAAVVGTIASAMGLGGGIALSQGLKAFFGTIGAGLPDSDLIVSGRTILVAAVVGIVVTMVSAVAPAIRASRVPPMAALREGGQTQAKTGWKRIAFGSLLTLAGLGAGAAGLFAPGTVQATISLLAGGAIGVFLGVTFLSPLLVEPLTSLLSWPLRRLGGITGTLAGENAGRNRRRTASTAAALMIGLAVVSMTLVVGESVKANLRNTLEGSLKADYVAVDNSDGFTPFPEDTPERLSSLDVTETVTQFFREEDLTVDGEESAIVGTNLEATSKLFDLDLSQGAMVDSSVDHPALVFSIEATEQGINVGDKLTVDNPRGGSVETTVIGIYEDSVAVGANYLVGLGSWEELEASDQILWMALSLVEGVDNEAAEEAFAPIVEDLPQMELNTPDGFIEDASGQIDQFLGVVNALVALAVLIALIGIANTLALSVFERTRELGLLRAVGMSRRQVRRMIRMEAALVAVFGAALGVAVGILFGWGAVAAIPAYIVDTLSIPFVRIAVLVVISGVAGLIAAWGPARRAGKLNVLDAIAE